jgi:glycosyltransferase involved in cell wall biosynthesis
MYARRILRSCKETWPIDNSAGQKPRGWPGWPEDKEFALVLTHDVESEAGLERVRRLAEMEMKWGVRSSFNFIPEGPYRAPKDLLQWLVDNDFEVGVHDLHHDGKLYRSGAEFVRKSKRINHYLQDWGATGFRSGFMLNQLDWLHGLNIQYDASTFDTDPFEPQPEGRHTIFPFWVPRRAALDSASSSLNHSDNGYVELPYTLPQDSTLFLLLREPTIDIWLRKLDWIAQHKGMALINIHPDYIDFDGKSQPDHAYPLSYYGRFLEHARSRYGDSFWQPLPRQLASFVAQLQPRPTIFRPKRICMVTHSFYESDNRVTRYAEALAARGDHVDVVAIRRSPDLPKEETIQGVNVFRVHDRFGKTERSKLAYLWPLLRFLRTSARWMTRNHRRRRYDLVHAHNVPDFIVFAAWYPKLTGARIILDVHDIIPEFFTSKFQMPSEGFVVTSLRWMERVSAALADHVIIANHLWLDKYAARTGTQARCTAFINNVDLNVFRPRTRQRQDDKLIILFPGGLQWHQGVDIAIRAFKKVKAELPQAEFHICGEGSAKDSLVDLAAKLELNGSVRFFKPISVRKIAAIMAEADLGVVPKRADSFGNEAYSTKIMEFMAVGVPVVVSNTKVDRHYFDDSVVRFFQSGDADNLARQIIELLRCPESRQTMVARATEYAAHHCWETCKADYLNLVDSLCVNRK